MRTLSPVLAAAFERLWAVKREAGLPGSLSAEGRAFLDEQTFTDDPTIERFAEAFADPARGYNRRDLWLEGFRAGALYRDGLDRTGGSG
jgi:hypothetical protein